MIPGIVAHLQAIFRLSPDYYRANHRNGRDLCAFYKSSVMIQKLVDFALQNKLLILCGGVLLVIWGAISFHNLPVEAYPDVADTWVQVITQWPGHAAEEVEQLVTIPIEIQLNGVAHLTHLRSLSLFGLSVVTIIFDDEADNLLSRAQVLEKLSQVTLPQNLTPQLGADYSPINSFCNCSGFLPAF